MNDMLNRATAKLAEQARAAQRYNDLYNGDGAIERLFWREDTWLPPERRRDVVINHAVTAIQPVAQRLQVSGFRTSAGDVVDNQMTSTWRSLGLDRASAMAQLEAMVTGRCAFMLGQATDGSPMVTVESPTQVTVLRDPATREPVAALKRYRDNDSVLSVLMTAEVIETYATAATGSAADFYATTLAAAEDAKLVEQVPNTLGALPVVMLVNQPRVGNPDGRSDIADIEDLLRAIAKLGSDMMTAAEVAALSKGIIMTPGEMTAEQAAHLKDAWQKGQMTERLGNQVGVLSGGADFKELTSAALTNFDVAIRLLVSQLAAITGLPPYYVSSDVANPTSADAIRSSESRLTARVKERQRWWSPAYAELMRLVQLSQDGYADPRLDDLEVLWVDPDPASIGQEADALSKLIGVGVIDRRAALESLNLPPVEIERILGTLPTQVA